jgi:hypothetical protein
MALEKCPECDGPLSSHAQLCPRCGIGGDALTSARAKGGCGCLPLLAVALVIWYFVSKN